MDFNELEAAEGVRLSWHVWPSSRIEASRCIVPFAAMYSPLQPIADMPNLPYLPLLCQNCQATISPFCACDASYRAWTCCFCFQRNNFPPHYHGISESNLPAELFPNHFAVEYDLGQREPCRPAIIFVIDTCLDPDELASLKKTLAQLPVWLPEDALVGLVTFGSMVSVHELGFGQFCSKEFLFRGDQETKAEKVLQMLDLQPPAKGNQSPKQQQQQPPPSAQGRGGMGRFLLPMGEAEFALSAAIEDLQPDHSPTKPGHRVQRATGAAIAISLALIEGSLPEGGVGRLVLLTGGPCTVGPGKVVDSDMSFSIRTHHDIANDLTSFFRNSSKFYRDLGQRLVSRASALDVFACTPDQVGIAEMKSAIQSTGGTLLLGETFDCDQFHGTLQKLFEKDQEGLLNMAFDGVVEVFTSSEVKVLGAIGTCANARKKTPSVSENQVGLGGTAAWRFAALSPRTALAVFFEVANQHSNPIPHGQSFFLQFIVTYRNPAGCYRRRVVTISRRWANMSGANPGSGSNGRSASSAIARQMAGVDADEDSMVSAESAVAALMEVAAGFDQETSAAIVARVAAFRAEGDESFDVLRWLDRTLIRLAAKFGEYVPKDPASFRFASNFSLFPQFVFHLRRSQFLQVFNHSPDESAFFRIMLYKENVINTLLMVQPTLISYSFDLPPTPVILDITSVQPDRILLFDSFFSIVVHHGSTIALWRKEGYHLDPTHTNFARLLQMPQDDARALVADRVPTPRLVVCDQNGSQARFLMARLNPSATHNSANLESNSSIVFTDDVNLETFTQHLQKLAVQ